MDKKKVDHLAAVVAGVLRTRGEVWITEGMLASKAHLSAQELRRAVAFLARQQRIEMRAGRLGRKFRWKPSPPPYTAFFV
jgi:hypothetical protein